MKKPARVKTEWTDAYEPGESSGPPMEQVTAPGAHAGSEFIERNHKVQEERRARYRRDYKGKIPPAQYQLSARTSKSSSRIRFPSEKFRRNIDLIDWEN